MSDNNQFIENNQNPGSYSTVLVENQAPNSEVHCHNIDASTYQLTTLKTMKKNERRKRFLMLDFSNLDISSQSI